MPLSAWRECAAPACTALTRDSYCAEHAPAARNRRHREYDATRASAARRGYGKRWRRLRLLHLQQHPLCRICEADGRTELATEVDHIKPHRGILDLLFDRANLQSLCKSCHSRKTATQDSTFASRRRRT